MIDFPRRAANHGQVSIIILLNLFAFFDTKDYSSFLKRLYTYIGLSLD